MKMIQKVANGCCDTLVNLFLFELFCAHEFLQHGRSKSPRWVFRQVDRDLEQCDANSLRWAIARLRRRGFIETFRGSLTRARITAAGRRWAGECFPTYHDRRPWDGRMHLVTYDVPERHRWARAQLRVFLRRIRCAPIQASVWITPYNPRKLLAEYVLQRRIPGVIVSEFGKGSVIGEGTYRSLMERAYDLRTLNDRYRELLFAYRSRKDARPFEVASAYIAILRDDPQLPFELLPEDWCGDDAHDLVQRWYHRLRRKEK